MKHKTLAIRSLFCAALAMLCAPIAAQAADTAAALVTLFPSHDQVASALGLAAALGFAGSIVSSTVEKHATSKWFCIATEGPTVDGRVIERAWVEQMAANYDPKVYGARLNLEHIKGIDPASLFKAYGDVIALKAEEVDGKMKLYAQIAPIPELVALTKAKQKIYTSCEVHPSFGDSKQAYLVGLAVTDNPASLGTDVLTFTARNTANLFSAAVETSIELEEKPTPTTEPVKALFASVSALLGKFNKRGAGDDARFADTHQAVELLAQHTSEQAAEFATLSESHTTLEASHAELATKYDALAQDFATLKETLSRTGDGSPARPTTTGAGNAVKTDC